jgi:hypothetical protein
MSYFPEHEPNDEEKTWHFAARMLLIVLKIYATALALFIIAAWTYTNLSPIEVLK